MVWQQTRQSRGLPTAGIVYGDEDDGLGDDDFGDSYGGDDDGGFGHVDADAFAAVSSQEAGEAGDKHPTARLSLEAAFQAGNTSVSYEDLCKKHIVGRVFGWHGDAFSGSMCGGCHRKHSCGVLRITPWKPS